MNNSTTNVICLFQDVMAEMLELKMMFPDTFKIFEVTTTYKILGDWSMKKMAEKIHGA